MFMYLDDLLIRNQDRTLLLWNPSVNSEVRSTCQRSEVEHEPITSTLSEVSVKHTDGLVFPSDERYK